jgi:hypothetical protein
MLLSQKDDDYENEQTPKNESFEKHEVSKWKNKK